MGFLLAVTTVDSGETNLRSVDKSFKRLDNDQDGRLDKVSSFSRG